MEKRRFIFENYGGSYQLQLDSGDDLAAILELDEPFWMATSAPKDQFQCDPVLLNRLDKDGNGRIQSVTIREAVRWLLQVLSDRTAITERRTTLALDAINRDTPDGQRLHQTARRILENLSASQADTLTLEQVRNHEAIFAQGTENGDGVIPPGAIADDDLRAFAEAIVNTIGAVPDASGADGVSAAQLDTFLEDAKALIAWQQFDDAALLPFGAETKDRYALYHGIAPKIDAYFQQCRVAALNALLQRTPEPTACPIDVFEDAGEAAAYLLAAPIAPPHPDGILPLDRGLNPQYRDAIRELSTAIFPALLGDDFDGTSLSEDQWNRVHQAFHPYEDWLAAKTGGQVETLGTDTLQRYIEGNYAERLRALIAADLDAGKELAALQDVEHLILLQRWILDVCNNFVAFPYLYRPDRQAMFEAGRMVMDGRNFHYNFRIQNAELHSATAARSGIFLLYSEVTGATPDETFFVVTPVTRGPMGNLGVGKRGVLFDCAGREWDTRVIRVVENPVNLYEAVAAPFRRLAALLSSTAERMTNVAEQQMQGRITQTTSTLETDLKQGIATAGPPLVAEPAPAPPPSGSRMRDMVLVGGVSAAALGSSFAYITKTFAAMNPIYILYAVVVIALLVLIPTTIVAIIKLRKQNLSAVLEASGWAINAPMRLITRLRRLIVRRPRHPKRFRLRRRDIIKVFSRQASEDKQRNEP